MKFKILIAGLTFAATFGANGQAQETTCEERGTNGMVTLVLCPPGLSVEELQQAGAAACGDRKLCGAWIWTNPADVPTEVPETHDKLTPEQITSSSGVWVNETQEMITLDNVPRKN